MIKNGQFDENLEKRDEEKKALIIHYTKFHRKELLINKIQLSEAYKVTFLEQSNKIKLDIAENFWITRLKAKINISRTSLPFYK